MDKSLNNLVNRLGNLGNNGNGGNNGDFSTWHGKQVIPLAEWRRIANHSHYYSFPTSLNVVEMLKYFPDEYNDVLLAFGVDEQYEDLVTDWWVQYVELHTQMLIWKYGQDNFEKMLNEQEWQREKDAWDFHESNRGRDDVGYYNASGCTSLQCVPTCEFYDKSTQNPEAFQLLQKSGYKDKGLPVIREHSPNDSIVFYDAEGNDVP